MYITIKELLGKTLINCELIKGSDKDYYTESDQIIFTTSEDKKYKLFHEQDCCEYVYVEDICGELNDLIGSPITLAEESSNNNHLPEDGYNENSVTWTFYRFATVKGLVVIRWIGSSNGYYSESVDFIEIK